MPGLLRSVAHRATDLLYPQRCVACGTFGVVVCERCLAAMPPATGTGRCPNCAAEWEGDHNCPRCLAWTALDGASAAMEMAGTARKVVHGLKYGRVRDIAPLMAQAMAPLREARPFDVAYPVPLHVSRLRDRGFNQAELLLRELDWPIAPGRLRRTRRTHTQVGRRMEERRTNVRGAFTYEGPALHGLTVALVDDVITTGATVNECAQVLKDAGARQVVGLAFARASYDPASPSAPRD